MTGAMLSQSEMSRLSSLNAADGGGAFVATLELSSTAPTTSTSSSVFSWLRHTALASLTSQSTDRTRMQCSWHTARMSVLWMVAAASGCDSSGMTHSMTSSGRVLSSSTHDVRLQVTRPWEEACCRTALRASPILSVVEGLQKHKEEHGA